MHAISCNRIVVLAILAWVMLMVTRAGESCDETVCGSIVSKCMLLQSCKCDDPVGNLTCARECFLCLDHLYSDCCTCLEMCPKPNNTDEMSIKSQVADLDEASIDIFQALTGANDSQHRWSVFSYPIHLALITTTSTATDETSNERIVKVGIATAAQDKTTSAAGSTVHQQDIHKNCTVAYMAQCMTWVKCDESCRSMGASSYRWFHDGCCECVGENCIDYGINESKCEECPFENEDEDEESERTSESEVGDDELISDKSAHLIASEVHKKRKQETGQTKP